MKENRLTETSTYPELEAICSEVRLGAFEIIKTANDGHLGSCSSSVELMVALYFGGILNYDASNPRHPDRDRVIVRGHVGPLRYKIFSLLGWVAEDELSTYRELGSRLQGHESMDQLPGVDITPSGSLGMVLSYGVGATLSARASGKDFKTFVFLGDGEEQEGNVSEAARHASSEGLENLICILDKNGAQLGHRTNTVDNASNIEEIWKGYGWNVITINNANDISEVVQKLSTARNMQYGKPTFVIANTTKGVHVPGATENFCGYHTIHNCPPEALDEAITNQRAQLAIRGYSSEEIMQIIHKKSPVLRGFNAETSDKKDLQISIQPPPKHNTHLVDGLIYYFGSLATDLKSNDNLRLYALTADLLKENQVAEYGFTPPVIYIDVGIREQHMLAMAHGIAVTDPKARIVIKARDAFFYRASDQLNAIVQGNSKMIIFTDDAGLSGARNGPTHQSSGQPGALLSMPGVQFYEPADVRDLYNVLNRSFTEYAKPTYIRIHFLTIPPLPRSEKDIESTSFYMFGEHYSKADLTIVSCGLTAKGALEAQSLLKHWGIKARLINIIDPNSLNDGFVNSIEEGAPILTVYNGNEAILRQSVAAAILNSNGKRPSCMYGHGFSLGTSGRLGDLIHYFRLDGEGILNLIRELKLFKFEL